MKPGFFQNEQLAELPYEARLLFIGLWCLADREGRLEDRPKRIKMHVFPSDPVDVDRMIDALAGQGLVVRYESNGLRCIEIPAFAKHQRPHSNETPSSLPPFHGEQLSTKDESAANQGGKHFALNPSSLNPDSLNAECLSRRSQARATRLPADFSLTPERQLVAEAEKLPAERVFAKFCDYWRAAAGAKARKHDWDATWRNWCRSEADRSRGTGKQAYQEPKLTWRPPPDEEPYAH